VAQAGIELGPAEQGPRREGGLRPAHGQRLFTGNAFGDSIVFFREHRHPGIEANGDLRRDRPFRQVTLIGFGEAGGILGEDLTGRASEPFSWKALADAIGKASPIESEALTAEAK
jgi:hypothetical protein